MFSSEVEESLAELNARFGDEITAYVRKVAMAESRSSSGSDPEDLIATSFIVLARAKNGYNSALGKFRNYAIRSLRNEFLRMNASAELLYDDFRDDNGVSTFQASETDQPFVYQSAPTDPVADHSSASELAEAAVVFVAALQEKLSPLEKALVYFMYYTSDDARRPSLRKLAEDYNLSYYLLLVALKRALSTLRESAEDAKASVDEILEMLR